VITLRRAEVNEGGACLPCAGKKNAELFQVGAITSCGKPEKWGTVSLKKMA